MTLRSWIPTLALAASLWAGCESEAERRVDPYAEAEEDRAEARAEAAGADELVESIRGDEAQDRVDDVAEAREDLARTGEDADETREVVTSD